MTREGFIALPASSAQQYSVPLAAMWFDAHGDWKKAHHLVQEDASQDAAWVHAYLHRKEGDESNAGYWYARSGRPPAVDSLADEWSAIVGALLIRSGG